jgi:hypothetical protein
VVFVKHGRTVHELTLGETPPHLDVELRIDQVSDSVLAGLAQFGARVAAADGVVRLSMDNEAAVPPMVRWLVECGIGVIQVRSERPSLERVFLEVMGDDQRPG